MQVELLRSEQDRSRKREVKTNGDDVASMVLNSILSLTTCRDNEKQYNINTVLKFANKNTFLLFSKRVTMKLITRLQKYTLFRTLGINLAAQSVLSKQFLIKIIKIFSITNQITNLL